MSQDHQAVVRHLSAVERSPTFASLVEIDTEISSLSLGPRTQPEWKNRRRAKLELWLRALDLIEKTKDPGFNLNDVPYMNVSPPAGTTVSAGADPSAIKDPKLRQEYERAIKLNAEKVERYRLQNGIRRLERKWTESVRVHIEGQYMLDRDDVDEIKTLIDRLISNVSRKHELRAISPLR